MGTQYSDTESVSQRARGGKVFSFARSPVQMVKAMLRVHSTLLTVFLATIGAAMCEETPRRNPIWDTDSLASPEVEDRVEYQLRYETAGGGKKTLTIAVNPWGAYRIEQDGQVAQGVHIQAAA